MNYFKTSEADTLRVKNLMDSLKGHLGVYCFYSTGHNCAGFTTAMLLAGGAIGRTTASLLNNLGGVAPNVLFWGLSLIDNQSYTPKEIVTHTIGPPVDLHDCLECD